MRRDPGFQHLEFRQLTAPLHCTDILELLRHVGFDRSHDGLKPLIVTNSIESEIEVKRKAQEG